MTEADITQIMQAIKEVDTQFAKLTSSGVIIPRDNAIGTIRKTMGDTYLRYLFNLNESDNVEKAILDAPHDQIQKLMQIVSLLTPILLEEPDLSTLPGTFCRCFGSELTLQDEFRVLNGGNPLRPPKTGDELLDSILESVQRIGPTLSITEWGTGDNTGTRVDRLTNYLQDDLEYFEKILCQEQCIKALGLDTTSLHTEENGGPGLCLCTAAFPFHPLDSLMIRKGLISNALYYANTLDYRKQESLFDGASRAVSEFRKLLSRQEITTSTLAILDGAKLTDEKDAFTTSGVLRKPTEYERKMILPLRINDPLVFEAECIDRLLGIGDFPKILSSKSDDPFSAFHWFDKQQKRLQFESILGGIRLVGNRLLAAMILAAKDTDAPVAHICGYWMPITLSSVASVFDIREQNPSFEQQKPVIEFSSSDFIKWFTLLSESSLPDTSLSRLVEAFSDKRSDRDALVDLLIVIEALFGAKNETLFKLSVCAAKLLSPTDEAIRHQKYREMREAYDVRSHAVHGGKSRYTSEQEKEILSTLRSNVKQLLKILLSDRKDILALSQDERIKKIALS